MAFPAPISLRQCVSVARTEAHGRPRQEFAATVLGRSSASSGMWLRVRSRLTYSRYPSRASSPPQRGGSHSSASQEGSRSQHLVSGFGRGVDLCSDVSASAGPGVGGFTDAARTGVAPFIRSGGIWCEAVPCEKEDRGQEIPHHLRLICAHSRPESEAAPGHAPGLFSCEPTPYFPSSSDFGSGSRIDRLG